MAEEKSRVTYLEEKPSRVTYLDEKPSRVTYLDKEQPSTGDIAKGIGAELLIGESAKYAGATIGSAVPIIGTAAGYITGGIIGGVAGSIQAQKEFEGRDEISWGRVTADTLLNLLPFGMGKVGKGAKVAKAASKVGQQSGEKIFPKVLEKTLDIGKAQAARAATGAGISVGALQVEKGIDGQGLLTPEEVRIAAGTGAVLNLGIGGATDAMSLVYKKKFAGKTASAVNANYKKGDPETVAFVDKVTGGDPRTAGKRMIDVVNSYVLPTKLLRRGTSESIRETKSKVETAKDTASNAKKLIDTVYLKTSKSGKESIDAYISGKTNALIPEVSDLKQTLDDVKVLQEKAQSDLLSLVSTGKIEMDPLVKEKIESSITDGGYKRTTYKFFEDVDYKPSEQSRSKLLNHYVKEGKTQADAEDFLAGLDFIKANKENPSRFGQSLKFFNEKSNFLKDRKNLPKELQEYLGIYERPGEKVAATLTGLTKYVSQELGDLNVTDNLIRSNIAVPSRVDESYVPLKLRNKPEFVKNAQGETLYVPDVVQRGYNVANSIDVGGKFTDIIDNTFGKMLGTTTGLTKFSAVILSPLNYPSQFISNQMDMAALGISPLKSFNPKKYEPALNDLNSTQNFTKFATDMLGFTEKGKPNLLRQNRLKDLQLMDKGVLASDIQNSFSKGIDFKPLKRGQEIGGKAYNIFDTTQRLIVFDHYKEFIRKQASKQSVLDMGNNPEAVRYAKAKLGKKASQESIKKEASDFMLEKVAAEITNSQFSNYGRVSPLFKTLSRYGALNEFGSFISEQLRTKYNQFAMAKNLMTGDFAKYMDGQYGLKFDDGALRVAGGKKFANSSVALGVLGGGLSVGGVSGVVGVSNLMRGISPEEEKAYKESVAAEWDEFNPLLIKRVGNDFEQINVGYQIPAAELGEVSRAALRGDNAFEAVGNAMVSLFSKLQGNGLGQTINLSLITEAFTNVDLQSGDPILEDEGFEYAMNMAKRYSYEAFTPSFAKRASRGELFEGNTKTKTLVDLALGLRRKYTTVEKGAFFKMRAINDDIGLIKRRYRSYTNEAIGGKVTINGQEVSVSDAYARESEKYAKEMAEVIKHVRNYKTLGVSSETISDKILKKLPLSVEERDLIMRGMLPKLRIATGISGKKVDRLRRYISIAETLPPEGVNIMLQQELDRDALKRSDLRKVKNALKMLELYK